MGVSRIPGKGLYIPSPGSLRVSDILPATSPADALPGADIQVTSPSADTTTLANTVFPSGIPPPIFADAARTPLIAAPLSPQFAANMQRLARAGKLQPEGVSGEGDAGAAPSPQLLQALQWVNGFLSAQTTALATLYRERPAKFWAVLTLAALGHPDALIAAKVLKSDMDDHRATAIPNARRLLELPGVTDIAGSVIISGLDVFLRQTGGMTDALEPRVTAVDNAIRGALYMSTTIEDFGAAAEEAGQTIGTEIEFFYKHPETGVVAKDPVYNALAAALGAALESQGLLIELLPGATSFVFSEAPVILPGIRGSYSLQGRQIDYKVQIGTGAINISVVPVGDEGRATTVYLTTSTDAEKGMKAMREEVARHLSITAGEVMGLEKKGAHVQHFMLMIKSNDGDKLIVRVEIDAASGMASGTLMNGAFDDGSTEFTFPATSYDEVMAYLKDTLRGTAFAKKVDKIAGLRIYDPDVIAAPGHRDPIMVLTPEVNPFSEYVSHILRFKDFPLMGIVMDTLKALGAKGTSPDRLVGVHVHMGIPFKNARGGYTIASMLGILREYLDKVDAITGIIPSNTNRQGYLQPIPPTLETQLQDPEFFKDPTDLHTILVFSSMVAGTLSKKFSVLNLDGVIALMLQTMIEDGTLKDGKKIEFDHRGEHYEFRVNAGDSRESYDVSSVRPGEPDVHLMRVAQPDFRRPTIEYRAPDSVIDSVAEQFLLSFMHAWAWRYGTSQAE